MENLVSFFVHTFILSYFTSSNTLRTYSNSFRNSWNSKIKNRVFIQLNLTNNNL